MPYSFRTGFPTRRMAVLNGETLFSKMVEAFARRRGRCCRKPPHPTAWLPMERKSRLVHGAYNQILETLSRDTESFPSELSLSRKLEVSRTVVRKAIAIMVERGIVQIVGRRKKRKRTVRDSDFFSLESKCANDETVIRRFFIDQMKSGAIRPGDRFSVLELSAKSGCNRTVVREFLYKFGKFGLVEKLPRKMWGMVKIDRQYIADLTEARKMLELEAMKRLWRHPDAASVWKRFRDIYSQLRRIAENPDDTTGENDFWPLDEKLYREIAASQDNRFLSRFHSTVYFVFMLHYQWCLWEGSEFMRSILALDIELLENIAQRKKGAAANIIREHCNVAQELFSEAIDMLAFP